ncbi:hypothetical protein CEXT_806951 [Caerostris extrusa]|uniref:Uncharacterized protein n=1 Tax=Caerostris extrusa TaxID=172846 RepID=A0AAV4TYE3_CAEEX|nr:hypothetical protein CEXT_806951 [Caerostris extrusa]
MQENLLIICETQLPRDSICKHTFYPMYPIGYLKKTGSFLSPLPIPHFLLRWWGWGEGSNHIEVDRAKGRCNTMMTCNWGGEFENYSFGNSLCSFPARSSH